MVYIQKWNRFTFQYRFLQKVKKLINGNNKLYCYFGFDIGYFHGINIYYGSIKSNYTAFLLSKTLKNYQIDVRLTTNIDYNFDLIVLFGYINNKTQIKYIKKNKHKILKALSLLLSFEN